MGCLLLVSRPLRELVLHCVGQGDHTCTQYSCSATFSPPHAVLAKILQELVNFLFNLWESLCDSFPDELRIYAKVKVDELIPHACHFFPRNSRILLAYFFGDLFHSFPYDFKLSHDSTVGPVIDLECI